jgi:hypothetical protein
MRAPVGFAGGNAVDQLMTGYWIAWTLHEIVEPLCTVCVFGYLIWKGGRLCVRRFWTR